MTMKPTTGTSFRRGDLVQINDNVINAQCVGYIIRETNYVQRMVVDGARVSYASHPGFVVAIGTEHSAHLAEELTHFP